VVAMARNMMKSEGMPERFWGEAVSTAVYLLNRAATKSVVGMMPYEAWYGRKPSVDHLRTFGCMVHVKTMTGHTSKLSDRSTPMVMIGYKVDTKAYRTYNPVNKKFPVSKQSTRGMRGGDCVCCLVRRFPVWECVRWPG
jgi:hypothetical protein